MHGVLAALAVFVALLGTPGTLTLAQEPTVSLEQQLADHYVPVAYIREQQRACAPTPQGGEPYLPVPVEMVLENERVLLRDAADGDRVLATGVGAAELATFGPDTYLDFPGDPRRPGCTFETDERIRIEELGFVPTVYARVVFDEAEQRLVIQYWFFWYFNDWNNTHEADWENVQLFWDEIATLDQALTTPPDRAVYSQHGGGEIAEWGDDKLQIEDGTHVLAFPAAGSHAIFYANHTYLGWGENGSGFGCDVSTAPSERVELTAVLVPDEIDPNGPFAWLLYPGRWGERQPAFFNGVHGPGFNSRWNDPWGSLQRMRTSSIVVPGSAALGVNMTDAFCALTDAGSQVLVLGIAYPWLIIPAAIIVAAILLFFYRRSRHFLRRAVALYRANWRVFIGIGLVAIPIGVVMNLFQRLVIEYDPMKYIVTWLDDSAGARLSTVLAVGGIQQLAMILIISPAVVQAVADINAGRQPGVVRSYKLAATRIVAIVAALVIIGILITIPLLTVIGIPIAIWLLVRWQFYTQVLIFDRDASGPQALQESARLVRNRWWKTLFAVFLFDLLATAPGVLVGFGLLTLGRTAVSFANSVSSLLYALLIPLSVIAITVMYLERRQDPYLQSAHPLESGTSPGD